MLANLAPPRSCHAPSPPPSHTLPSPPPPAPTGKDLNWACDTGVRGDVDRMSQSLRLFSDTLEEWLECQKKWLYLENIFMAPDIQRQLPNETMLFGTVDRQFKSILRITRDRPAALPVSEPVWYMKSPQHMHSVYQA